MRLTNRQLALLLASLSAIGPFAIDTYLPAFPAIAASLHASDIEVQQTLAAYLTPFAFMMLWHGPLSDAQGRRPMIIGGMALFAIASLVCALAPSIEWLWFGRALQGTVAGAGFVVSRAMVRDLYDGVEAQKLMSNIAVLFAIAPAIAPVIGGGLLAVAGWRGIFFFLALFAGIMCFVCARFLPETLPADKRHPLQIPDLWRSYVSVSRHHEFRRLAFANAFNFIGLFIYVLAAPVFLIRHLGFSEQQFAWMFMPVVGGMMVGSALSGRLAGKLTAHQMLRLAYGIMSAAMLANITLNLFIAPGLWCIAPLVVYCLGMALAMPNMQLLALDHFPHRRGLASSCLGVIQTSCNAIASALIVPLIWDSPLHLALGMGACMSIGLICYSLSRRAHRNS